MPLEVAADDRRGTIFTRVTEVAQAVQSALNAGLVPGLQPEFQDLKNFAAEELFFSSPLPIRGRELHPRA